jgi:hypothetical protein
VFHDDATNDHVILRCHFRMQRVNVTKFRLLVGLFWFKLYSSSHYYYVTTLATNRVRTILVLGSFQLVQSLFQLFLLFQHELIAPSYLFKDVVLSGQSGQPSTDGKAGETLKDGSTSRRSFGRSDSRHGVRRKCTGTQLNIRIVVPVECTT